MTTRVHFVGSIGLDTSEEVFEAVGATVKPFIKRCPDGEVGGRRLWISWQWPVLRSTAFLEVAKDQQFGSSIGLASMRVKPGVKDEDIRFGELGYAREARTSYQDFLRARERGVLPREARFQVCLPTPIAVVGACIVPEDLGRVLPAYDRAMVREAERVCAAIPHRDLALQWDVCIEMIQWDGRVPFAPPPPDMERLFAAQFARLSAAVSSDVELGFHLCYGDLDAKHFVEPQDLGKAVELANLILSSARRPVTWIHMPVPANRDDDAYFAPLKQLQRGAGTELYLGLVHATDGVEGTLRRMRTAARHVGEFGIATECGMGRARTPEMARELMRVHAGAAAGFQGEGGKAG